MISDKLTSVSLAMSRFGDLVLAGLVVFIIGLLIVPLPTPMVDFLIATNIMISTVMLMLSLYLPRALAFSTFPSMLLFTTLFRLALNVTTTRLILLHANAGEIIYTFGNFVVGGDEDDPVASRPADEGGGCGGAGTGGASRGHRAFERIQSFLVGELKRLKG